MKPQRISDIPLSPRPESTSSCTSVQSNVSVHRDISDDFTDLQIGEEMKIAVTTAIERFRLSTFRHK